MSNTIPGNNKHLTLSDRSYIESAICKGESFINISKYLCKDPSTIGREVLKHRILDSSQYKKKLNNYCAKRFDCKKTHVCLKCDKYYYKNKRCATCSKCNVNCKDFVKESCIRNTSAPYVCNGCHKQKNCHLDKHFYFATHADKDYKNNLSEIRQGINITESNLAILDSKISPLIINGQSPYQIIENHPEVNCSVKTLYNYIEYNLGTAAMYDLMPIILTDRGFEFTHPKELEYGSNELKRTKIFYCNSMSAYQKGRLEKNHEYIRKFFPKGSTFDNLTQDDINLMLSHINSSKRKILGNKSPIEVFLEKQNDSILELLDIKLIEPDKVILNKNLF